MGGIIMIAGPDQVIATNRLVRYEMICRRQMRRVTPGFGYVLIILGAIAVLPVFPGPTLGQAPPAGGLEQPRPGDIRPRLPDLDRPRLEPGLKLPPVPPPGPDAPLSRGPEFVLRTVEFDGNTVFSDQDLAAIAEPFLGRVVATEDLEDLRRALTLRYVEAGYINSGAVLPDQTVLAGTVTYRIVEGALTAVTVSGNQRIRASYVEDRIRLSAGPPLNVGEMQERLRILLDDPLIDRIDSELGPGLQPGESELRVRVQEPPPIRFHAFVDNERSPSVGGEQVGAELTLRNVSGIGEVLTVASSKAEGLLNFEGDGSLPVTRWDTMVIARVDYTTTEIVEEPFNSIDIESDSVEVEGGLRQPLYRAPGEELSASLTFNWRESDTFLLGRRFSFAEGVNNGKSTVSVIRGTVDWLDRDQQQAIALRSTMSGGISVLGATINPPGVPDGKFFAWLGQAQWVRRIDPWDLRLVVRGEAQLTPDRLLPLEKFAIGGANTVRGYRENFLVRDNGWDGSVELRIPVLDLTLPYVSPDLEDGRVELAPFLDVGQSWNTDIEDPSPKTIASVGIGLRWAPIRGMLASLYYGYALRDVDEFQDKDLQDHGIHFAVRVTAF